MEEMEENERRGMQGYRARVTPFSSGSWGGCFAANGTPLGASLVAALVARPIGPWWHEPPPGLIQELAGLRGVMGSSAAGP